MDKDKVMSGSDRVYIVSGDLRAIVGRWLGKEGPFFLPDKQLFDKLQSSLIEKLKEVFEPRGVNVIYLSWEYLKTGLLMLIADKARDIPVISLDHIYVGAGSADIYFDTNRIVGWSDPQKDGAYEQGWSEIGHGSRKADLGISAQLVRIVNQGRIFRMQDKRVAVVDDGIWTRGSLIAFKKLLESVGIRVEKFIVGVEIRPEQESDENSLLDIPFHWVEKFKRECVVDWTGERDFFPGVGFSGRTVGEKIEAARLSPVMSEYYYSVPLEGNYGAPYVLPLGHPVSWANIPDDEAKDFSRHCLKLTQKLYLAIEAETRRVTGNTIRLRVHDLDRPPFFYRTRPDSFITDELETSIELLKESF